MLFGHATPLGSIERHLVQNENKGHIVCYRHGGVLNLLRDGPLDYGSYLFHVPVMPFGR